jgi:hypothetical protein
LTFQRHNPLMICCYPIENGQVHILIVPA